GARCVAALDQCRGAGGGSVARKLAGHPGSPLPSTTASPPRALRPPRRGPTLAGAPPRAAGGPRALAGHGATAGAAALIQGRDAARAAEEALPGWVRRRAKVTVDGRRVSVRVVPPGAGPLARLLEARSLADAGPAP
ncbi:MAG: hypothetical protein ACKOB9_01380, partial [Solirubrobacterales bacterium]